MPLRVFRPSALLAPYVSAIWDYDDLLGDRARMLSILPDTATYLCFLYADLLTTRHKDRLYTTRSGVAGFQTFRNDLGGAGTVSGVSARLTPWGLSVLRRGIVPDCAERRVDCRDIFPRYDIERLEDTLAGQPAPEARVGCVERFLLSSLNRHREDLRVRRACRVLDRSGGTAPIARLARSLELSERTLERRFRLHVGVSPKKYARVVRVRNALLQRRVESSWAEVACATGYYDQSHMINDFRELYGMSPEALTPRMEASRTIRFSGLLDLS